MSSISILQVSSPLITELPSQGNNYVTYTFKNGETYKFYFYINAYDYNLYMSIFDLYGTALMEDRAIVISNNLFGDVQELAGTVTVTGTAPTLDSIDNTCNINYRYYLNL